ncbi:Pantothenate kinase 2 [Bienertia sinuspersici]
MEDQSCSILGIGGNSATNSDSDSYDHDSPWALDIGGSLIKLVYFSRKDSCLENNFGNSVQVEEVGLVNGSKNSPILDGKLHFAKFETKKINEHQEASDKKELIIKATGGGAYKYADLFKEKFGIRLDKEDEMDCLVDGDGKFERVSGTSVGGGTFFGSGKIVNKMPKGNNRVIDMLVGDIYGDWAVCNYNPSSFGKPVSDNKELEDYNTADVARSLLRLYQTTLARLPT